MPNGPAEIHAEDPPKPSTRAGTISTQAQTSTPANTPSVTERAGVCGRQTANATAGARVARPENEMPPMSARASLPEIARLYTQASKTTARMPMRRCMSTATSRSRPSATPRDQAPRHSSGLSQ